METTLITDLLLHLSINSNYELEVNNKQKKLFRNFYENPTSFPVHDKIESFRNLDLWFLPLIYQKHT